MGGENNEQGFFRLFRNKIQPGFIDCRLYQEVEDESDFCLVQEWTNYDFLGSFLASKNSQYFFNWLDEAKSVDSYFWVAEELREKDASGL